MANPQKGYLVNINQANVAIDGKARIHKLSANQPPKCQIEKSKMVTVCGLRQKMSVRFWQCGDVV